MVELSNSFIAQNSVYLNINYPVPNNNTNKYVKSNQMLILSHTTAANDRSNLDTVNRTIVQLYIKNKEIVMVFVLFDHKVMGTSG